MNIGPVYPVQQVRNDERFLPFALGLGLGAARPFGFGYGYPFFPPFFGFGFSPFFYGRRFYGRPYRRWY